MADREKVIKGLECCTRYEVGRRLHNCLDCPYVEPIGFNQFRCKSQEMKEDALFLLKEQEAVEPKTEPSAKGYWYTCGVCGWWLFEVRDTVHFDDRKRIHFCASCGQAVKWE